MTRHIPAFVSLCLCLLALSCTGGPTPEVYKSDDAFKEMPAFSPEYAPKDKKGPGDMPDLEPMWRPLNSIESSAPVSRRGVETLSALELPPGLSLWMPTGEQTVLRGYLYRLRGQQRYVCARAAERSGLHAPAVKEALMAYGLPPELVAFPLVLSSYEASGVSSRGAAGLWQLTPETAREYGLKVTGNVDERLDPVKATGAAARYIKYLYERFADWQIVLLAYREGEGRVRQAVETAASHSFEELAEFCRANNNHKYALSENALQNVPKFVAALIIMTNSKELGFTAKNILELGQPTVVDASEERGSRPGRPENRQNGALVDLPLR